MHVDAKNLFFICVLKVMESESKLKESLIECDREKEEFELKCTVLEREKVEQSQMIRYVREIISYNVWKMSDLSLNLSEEIVLICWLAHFYPQSPPSPASQPAEGGGEAGQVCGCRPPGSAGRGWTKGLTSGAAAYGAGSGVQEAGLAAQGAGRPADSDSEPRAEGGPEPQRGSAEPGGAGQPGGHTGPAASTRGGEEYTHTITLSFVPMSHGFVKSPSMFDLRDC